MGTEGLFIRQCYSCRYHKYNEAGFNPVEPAEHRSVTGGSRAPVSSPRRVVCARRVRRAPGKARSGGDRAGFARRAIGCASLWILSLAQTRESIPGCRGGAPASWCWGRAAARTVKNQHSAQYVSLLRPTKTDGYRCAQPILRLSLKLRAARIVKNQHSAQYG